MQNLDLGFTFGDGVKKISARVLTEKAKDCNMSYICANRIFVETLSQNNFGDDVEEKAKDYSMFCKEEFPGNKK
jgi:hypothetical protein